MLQYFAYKFELPYMWVIFISKLPDTKNVIFNLISMQSQIGAITLFNIGKISTFFHCLPSHNYPRNYFSLILKVLFRISERNYELSFIGSLLFVSKLKLDSK